MKNRETTRGLLRLLVTTLFGGVSLVFGGAALAATVPTVEYLKLIEKYLDASGNVIEREIKMNGMAMPHGVAMDDKFNIYVADPVNHDVSVYKSNGNLAQKITTVKSPTRVSVKGDGSQIYVTGNNSNGTYSIYVLNNNGDIVGNLGGWMQPDDTAVASSGDFLGADTATRADDVSHNVIRLYSGGDLERTYGPYAWRATNENYGGVIYADTKHTLSPVGGLAISGSRIYVTVIENVERGSAVYDAACDPSNSTGTGCYQEDNLFWYPLGNYYWVAVIDTVTGRLVKIDGTAVMDDYSDLIRTFTLRGFISQTACASCNPVEPKGLALDEKSRLYVSTAQSIRVFGVDDGLELTVNGFPQAPINDIYFDGKNSRLLVAVGDSVILYGIDGGTNPSNEPPTVPSLSSPINTYVNSLTPNLDIVNSTDPDGDPITYAYEVTSAGNVAANGTGFVQGTNGTTQMTVGVSLMENTLYRWRAQAFDGRSASSWTETAEFCINLKNDNPLTPEVISPVNLAPASPFGSVLAWNASSDPDCYDTWTYTVEISNDLSFSTILRSMSNLSGISLPLGQIANDFANGSTYYWRVKAVDNQGGESLYGAGSFVYRTTIVRFESAYPGAKVYMDGNYGYRGMSAGTAPGEIQNVAPGKHTVTFIKDGYEPYYTMVDVDDPLTGNNIAVVSAGTDKWVRAFRIKPSITGSELLKIDGGNASPFIVDYNNDGLKDVVVGGKVNVYNDNGEIVDVIDGKIYLYLGQEVVQDDGSKSVVLVNGGALQADGSDVNVGSRAVPYVVDYNNDGRKDILAGNGDGKIYLYLNKGTEVSPVFASAVNVGDSNGEIKVVGNSAPLIVDYNSDEKKDMVVGSADGTLRLYLNSGTDASPVFTDYQNIKADGSDINVGHNSKAFFTDWNNDGKKDLLVGGGDGLCRLYLNVGSDGTPGFLSIQSLQEWIRKKQMDRTVRTNEYISYLGYTLDLGELTGGYGDASPFVVDMGGLTRARDVVVGNGNGGVVTYFGE